MNNNQFLTYSNDLHLPDEMREELANPLGELITKTPTLELIKRINADKPPLVVLVGDYCVEDALKHNLIPDISIIDGKNLREPYKQISIHNAKVIKSKNPPAIISIKTWKKIKKAINLQLLLLEAKKPKEPIVLLIEGEEDLLVLPTTLEVPDNSYVVYGQPHQGIVLIKVTANVKFKFKKLIERMKVEQNED